MFSFNRDKAIESIIYLLDNLQDADDKEVYSICKLLYFADKTSLKKYGCFIFGETYCAMENGATPSNAYDLLKQARTRSIKGIKVKGNRIEVTRKANRKLLSETDRECLDLVVEKYRGNGWLRWKDAHDEAYNKNWEKRGEKESIPISVLDIAKFSDNSSILTDFLINRDKD
jgi:hypothetical protein